MAEGEGHTLEEAFEAYGRNKAGELLDVEERKTISLKLRPNNQWVKGFKVKDAGS